MSNSSPIRAYPRNVEGDFYVEDGCCITCGVMHEVAAELFAWDEYSLDDGSQGMHCYVSRQPASPIELEAMIRAMDVTEVDCVRYRGDDPGLLRRFVERGQSDLLDGTLPADIVPLSRNTMRIDVANPAARAAEFARAFAAYAAERWRYGFEIDALDESSIVVESGDVVVSTISFRHKEDAIVVTVAKTLPEDYFNILTGLLHSWQAQTETITSARWLTAIELADGAEGQPQPS